MADIGESIFGAVSVIVDRKLSDLRFDKTITGLIESIDGIAEEGKENKYIVNDGITKYVAYSNNVRICYSFLVPLCYNIINALSDD